MQPAADGLAADLDLMPARSISNATASQHQRLRRKPKSRGACWVTQSTTTATQAAAKRKGRPGLCPATASTPSLVEPLDPAVDGAGAAEQHGGDGRPGVAVGQEQEDVGAEADLGVGVLAISVEQRLALPGVEGHAAGHGASTEVRIELVYSIVQAPSTFPVAWIYLERK